MTHTRKITLAALALLGLLGPRAAQAQTPPDADAATVATPPPATPVDPAPGSVITPDGAGAGAKSAWYLQAEFLFLRRDVPRRNMSQDVFDGTLVTTKELSFGFEPGFRLGIGYQCSPTWALEASFFTTADWSSKKSNGASAQPFPIVVNGPPSGTYTSGSLFSGFSQFGNNVALPFVYPFDGAAANFMSYSARLDDLEFNLRHQVAANGNFVLNTLVGIRNVHTKERFSFSAVGTTDNFTGSPAEVGEYAVEANNDLFDFQVGGDLFYWCSDSFSVSGIAKAGYGWNRARQRTAINDAFVGAFATPGSVPFPVTAVSEHVGGAGSLEYGIFANWRLGYGCCARLGYQALFLTNMALAPRQVVFSTAPNAQLNVDRNGTILLHGPSAGIEFNW